MNVNLLTDAKYHNLALMKLSAYHKMLGDKVYLNGAGKFDLTYGSWLFDFSEKGICDIEGGPGIDPSIRLDFHEDCPRDYKLFNLDYSLGYTWKACFRKCPFCIVRKQDNPLIHESIWSFHNSKFKKICLLNNNTFSDFQWRETFQEIWEADLSVIDENGYDLRLIDEEKALALKKTKWATPLHFAWDQIKDERRIRRGLKIITGNGMRSTANGVYILIGFNTTREEDLHRCQIVNDFGLTPYPMPFKRTPDNMKFKRFINLHYYRQYPTIEKAWRDYNK